MGKGGFLKSSNSTYYVQEYSWKRSPEVWGTMLKVFGSGAVLGAVLAMYAGCSDVAKDAQAPVPCKPTVSTSQK